MDSLNRHGEANIKPAKGKLPSNLDSEDEYGMHRSEGSEELLDWSKDPRSEASLEAHGNAVPDKRITDDELKNKILSFLKLRGDVGGERITAEVSSGVVTLTGEVATREQKIALERAIETIGYIRDILNQVQIKSGE